MAEGINIQTINEGLALILAKELHSYCLEGEQRFDEGGEFFSSLQQRRVVEIGRSLDSIGGWRLMSAVYEILPRYSQTHVNRLWQVIRNWCP